MRVWDATKVIPRDGRVAQWVKAPAAKPGSQPKIDPQDLTWWKNRTNLCKLDSCKLSFGIHTRAMAPPPHTHTNKQYTN